MLRGCARFNCNAIFKDVLAKEGWFLEVVVDVPTACLAGASEISMVEASVYM